MIYVFKCQNEDCKMYNIEVEVEQRITDKHVAKCEDCKKKVQRVFTTFTIGVPQGNVSVGGMKIPAKRAREIERKREQKEKQGGGEYWDNRKHT